MLVGLLVAFAAWSAPVSVRADGLDLRGQVAEFWTTVAGQDRGGLRDRLFGRGRPAQVDVGRFSTTGGPSFTLDQTGVRPLLRFEDSTEIWTLRPSAGVRGDIYYRNDVGEVVLRATRIGGLTLYTADNPGGVPCALEGGSQPLRLSNLSPTAILRHVSRESVRASRAVGGLMEISAPDFDESAVEIIGDTATVSVDAIVRLSQTDSGRERLAGLRQLQILVGASPGVRRNGAALIVTINPRHGPSGRPSSARVMRALQG